jgi:hypothetical protein
MFKWVSWVIRMGATALLLSFLCIWTTGYIVNSYMETVIKQLELPIQVQPLALSGVWGKLWGAQKAPEAQQGDASASKQQDALNIDLSSGDPLTAGESTKDNIAEPTPSPEAGHDAGSSLDEGSDDLLAEPALGEQIELPQLSDSERQELYAMVVSKLSQEQLKQLSNSLQGGLAAEELAQLQTMLQSTLTDAEYTQMMDLLQGKKGTDEEVLAE